MLLSSNETSGGKTILIVDDNLNTTAFLKDLILNAGLSCITCDCGLDALKIVKKGTIDLVLLDIVMPDINGLTVTSQIKTISGKKFLPVILLTALSESKDIVAGLMYADDYITKPFSGEELLARIKSLLRTRELQNQLLLSTSRYKCLYENFPSMYITVDSYNNIIDCNRFFCDTFRLKKDDVVGRSIFNFFKEDRLSLEHFLSSISRDQSASVQQMKFCLTGIAGSPTMMVKMNAVYVGDEETGLSVVISMEDITQQLRLEEEQKLARKQLYRSARLASIGTLASGVAHELNNPLTAILGFSSALIDRIKMKEAIDEAELNQYLQIINSEALRCRDTVEVLTRFAREGGIQTTNVILHNCIENALKLVQPRADKTGIIISNEVPDNVIVRADSLKLGQVFVNVISNCIDFCPSGSNVSISPSASHDPSRLYSVRISDNGPGIKPDVLSKIFDPFFTTKDIGGGAGMGLAICHKIMEDCNGSIDIISEYDNGTKVNLEIPFEKDYSR
ncbi:MAG: response regulator [Fibrobacter sp.]|nr:response regulator [Fibrobacter sp.]